MNIVLAYYIIHIIIMHICIFSKCKKISAGQRSLQSCLWSRLGRVQGRWAFKGHRVISRIRCCSKGPRRGLWICVFISHALKFRSEPRHVLIFPVPSGLGPPGCLWLLAVLVTEFSGYVCRVLGSHQQSSRETWVGHLELLTWTLITPSF